MCATLELLRWSLYAVAALSALPSLQAFTPYLQGPTSGGAALGANRAAALRRKVANGNAGDGMWQPLGSGVAWPQVAPPQEPSLLRGDPEREERWELSKLPPAQQAQSLGTGLLRMSDTFGWCLSDADAMELKGYQAQLEGVTTYMTDAERLRVKVATEVAFQAHNGQRRKSGEAFVVHPVAVACILARLQMDCDTVVAGLLHDTVEDTCLAFEDLQQQFGDTVRKIVEGETKVSKLPGRVADYNDTAIAEQPLRAQGTPAYDKQASNLRHMLIAMSEDWRVLVVKLADRLHNMQTIGAMPAHKQQRIARETMDVFVPLAHRLGLWEIKCELEELCFPLLDPLAFKKVQQLVQHRAVYTRHTPEVLEAERARFENVLLSHPLLCGAHAPSQLRVSVGAKTLYDVHRALQRSARGFFDVHDVVRFTVTFDGACEKGVAGSGDIASPTSSSTYGVSGKHGEVSACEYEAAQRDKALCYRVMEAVHAVLQPTSPPRVKDYIAFPKNNGYTSLHTTVFLLGYPIEVQIRTTWMDRVASTGVAAGWLGREHKGFSMRLPWLREVQRCVDEACAPPAAARPYSAHIRQELEDAAHARRFVFTSEGAVLDLAGDATVGDAAEEVTRTAWRETGVKQRVVAAKVNSRLVGLKHRLSHGDVITIITTPAEQAVAAAAADAPAAASASAAAAANTVAAATSASISGANGSTAAAASSPIVLGNVRTQLVRSGVWPWCLVGADDDAESDSGGGGGGGARDAGDGGGRMRGLRSLSLPRAQQTTAADDGMLNGFAAAQAGGGGSGGREEEGVTAAKATGVRRKGAEGGEPGATAGDQLWYREAELKHGRMSILALVGWFNAEVVHWAGGRVLGASAAASSAHEGPLAHLYSLTPLQAAQVVAAVGMVEWCHAATQNAVTIAGRRRGASTPAPGLFVPSQPAAARGDKGGSSSGGSGAVQRARAAVAMRGSKEATTGRFAMLAVAFFVVQSFATGDDALGHAMGLF